MPKKFDIVATVGEYTDSSGQAKKRYKNVGVIMSNDNGFYMLMDKTFSPAGLAEPGKESIILSLFEPKEKQQQQAPASTSVPHDDTYSDDIPFN